ncbi:MAG: ABC transporter ATP-binding protein [Planctomycetes bacterium]|nr:ABC transporter ATP-binding protein [Planctomycetota bacterium]
MAEIILDRIGKVYPGSVRALDGIEMRIDDGELLVVTGPSGAGKSTLLRIIAGLEAPSSGRVVIGERDVTRLSPRLRDVAMVFQQPALYPHLSIRENLAFPLRRRRVPPQEIRRRVDEASEALGIGHLLDRRPDALSGGEQTRASLGRAIVRRPAAFLLDEPLSHLDAPLRSQLRSELMGLHRRERVTALLVTHDQEEAMAMGERIAVIDRGSLQQIGPPRELYLRPANLFVAGFLGRPPMSLLRGRLRSRDGGAQRCFEVDGGSIPIAAEREPADGDATRGEIILGIRSESISLPGDARGDAGDGAGRGACDPGRVAAEGTLDASVARLELLGRDADVHLRTAGGQPLVHRIDRRRAPAPGAIIRLRIDAASALFFEPAGDGRRLPAAGEEEMP